jgi:exonuclease VII large subunit
MSINVNIDTEKVQRTTDVQILCQNAQLTIANQGDYESASIVLKNVKSRYKELDEQRKEITKPIDDAKKSVMNLFKAPLELLEKAENHIKRQMIDYTNEQERKAREEQLRLQRIAEQEAEKERKRIEAQIQRAEASGKLEKAGMLKERKEDVEVLTVPVVAPRIETPKGVSFREAWSAEVTNIDLVPREYLMVNLQALNKVAQATKGSLVIPGVKFNCEKILASRN